MTAAALRHEDPASLSARLRRAQAMTPSLMLDVMQTCRRVPSLGQSEHTARLMHLIDAEAWTDTALLLMELELRLWQVRRIAYDDGEWHCALSRERELPDWLDAAIEAQHADLALALLSAFVEVQASAMELSRPGAPSVRRSLDPLYEPAGCGNFS